MKKAVGQDKLNNNSSLLDNSLEVYFTNLEKTQVYDCSKSQLASKFPLNQISYCIIYWTNNKTLNVPFSHYEHITLEFMTKNAIPENYFYVEKPSRNLFGQSYLYHTSLWASATNITLFNQYLSHLFYRSTYTHTVLENYHKTTINCLFGAKALHDCHEQS